MAARVVDVCQSLETYITQQMKDGVYGFTFNVKYANPAYHRLESTKATWLFIYPGPEGPTTATRNKWRHVYNAAIHLINYIDGVVPQSEIEDATLLMERVIDSLKQPRIAGMSAQEFGTEDNPEPPYIDESTMNLNLVQSVRRVTYMEMR